MSRFPHKQQLQSYLLSIRCPSPALLQVRRELQYAAQEHGLRIRRWDETLPSDTPAPSYQLNAIFLSRSETCMHFLQTVASQLLPLPLIHVRLECLTAQQNEPQAIALLAPLARSA